MTIEIKYAEKNVNSISPGMFISFVFPNRGSRQLYIVTRNRQYDGKYDLINLNSGTPLNGGCQKEDVIKDFINEYNGRIHKNVLIEVGD